MNQYYLMAQLPGLDGLGETEPLPITEDAFYELCGRFLGEKAAETFRGLSLIPDRQEKPVHSEVVRAWNHSERQLRLALGSVRAARLKKSFDTEGTPVSADVVQAAKTAVEMSDPMAAEQYLNQYRLEVLDRLRPQDAFSEDAVFHYGLKLKLLSRIRRFDAKAGREAYGHIYGSILHRASQEGE